jgi:hypothetical protein
MTDMVVTEDLVERIIRTNRANDTLDRDETVWTTKVVADIGDVTITDGFGVSFFPKRINTNGIKIAVARGKEAAGEILIEVRAHGPKETGSGKPHGSQERHMSWAFRAGDDLDRMPPVVRQAYELSCMHRDLVGGLRG